MKPYDNPALEKKFDQIEAATPSQVETKTAITYAELEKIIKDYLLIDDEGLIKLIVTTVVCHRLPIEPVWLLIVAGPGAGKTELLSGLYDLNNVYPLSDLTPQTFMSGYKDEKGSLLHRLPKEVLIIMKDFTTVLEFNSDKQATILAQFREIYDGSFGKEFGNAESRTWNGKMGFIAGVTPVVDRKQPIQQALGERFIKYRPVSANSIEITKRAMANSGNEKQMREDIKNAFTNYIENLELPDALPIVPQEYQDAIMHLAVFCAKARSVVLRDGSKTREVIDIPEPEHPTRLVKQLLNSFIGLSVISGGFNDDDYRIIYKIGMDSLTATRRLIIDHLFNADSPQTLADIATAVGYPQNTTRRQLEDMECLKLTCSDNSLIATVYELAQDTREQLQQAMLVREPNHDEGVDND
jgi:hypothetical protein